LQVWKLEMHSLHAKEPTHKLLFIKYLCKRHHAV